MIIVYDKNWLEIIWKEKWFYRKIESYNSNYICTVHTDYYKLWNKLFFFFNELD